MGNKIEIKNFNIVNKQYNYFKVLEIVYNPLNNKHTRKLAKCQCNCGNIFEARIDSLNVRKGCRLCGIKYGGENRILLDNEAAKRTYFSSYRNNAKTRNLTFLLIREEFDNIISQNCYWCGDSPKISNYLLNIKPHITNFYCNGIDRLDNNLGYTIENCVPCCTNCNMMKKTLSSIDFIDKIIKIYKQNKMKTKIKKNKNAITKNESPSLI